MQCESEQLPAFQQWGYIDTSDEVTAEVPPSDTTTQSDVLVGGDDTDLFRDTILLTDMRNRKPTVVSNKSILQSPHRSKLVREKSVNWKDNLVEYRYIDGNPAARRSINWGSVLYAVVLIVSSYMVYCMLHSIGIKPRGLR